MPNAELLADVRPELRGEKGTSVRDNVIWYAVMSYYIVKEERCNSVASTSVVVAIKCTCFISRHTNTMIASWPDLVNGNPVIASTEILPQRLVGIGRGDSNPPGLTAGTLFLWHRSHELTYSLTSRLIRFHQKCAEIRAKVRSTPVWPPRGESCAS